ncbi:hypothetical protein [Rhodococcus kronopolitis]|uniref:DUF4932 domain-containing protein n=1 Tax=Rhodococcus kronopolitis TaxID=1460226 RepID=A0ABV9FVW1_9NOCA
MSTVVDHPPAQARGQVSSLLLTAFVGGQPVNVRRHLDALRDFRRDEFGTSIARPSEGHVQAVNALLARLRQPLQRAVDDLEQASRRAGAAAATTEDLSELLRRKSLAHDWVRATERVWDFYFELFGQRQGAFGEWLFACDRIALDCYQYIFLRLGAYRSIPSPPPFAYMRTGFSPATYRRNIPLRRLGAQLNPFPLVQLPYHRLVNPWTMGAILHEVSHNLQNELQLERDIPRAIGQAVRATGAGPAVAAVWSRWNREIFGDLAGVLLGGEAFVASLMDVIGRAPEQALAYSPRGVHPTPYLRTFLSTELLRRMGFADTAAAYEQAWRRLYPTTTGTTLPVQVLRSWPACVRATVDAVCYTRYPGLGDKTLRQVIAFTPRHQRMIEEAGVRLARGVDPGVVPERFLIGAVRYALDRRLAEPDSLMRNFYTELSRR